MSRERVEAPCGAATRRRVFGTASILAGLLLMGVVVLTGIVVGLGPFPPTESLQGVASSECTSCTIEIVERTVLGSRDDPTGPSADPRVAIGRGGRPHVISRTRVPGASVYSRTGAWEGMLGRAGDGPGELTWAYRIDRAPDSGIALLEPNGVIHHFGPDTQPVGRHSGLPRLARDLLLLNDTLAAILTGDTRPSEIEDHEVILYHWRSGTPLRGIGPESDLTPGGVRTVTFIAPGADGGVWLGRWGNVIERWTLGGELSSVIRLPEGWPEESDLGAEGAAVHGWGQGWRLAWDDLDAGILWLAGHARADDAPALPDVVPGAPVPIEAFGPGWNNASHRSVIAAVDRTSGRTLATRILDEHVYHLTRDGRVVLMHEAPDGHVWVELIRPALERGLKSPPAPLEPPQ